MNEDKPLPTSALAVANEFIALGVTESDGISHLVLQKLLYIAHGCSLAICDTPLFIEEVRAWKYGPVVDEVYHKCKRHGQDPITEFIQTNYRVKSETHKKLIKAVFKKFAGKKPWELVAQTHMPGAPWDIAQKNHDDIVSEEAIKEFYKHLIFDAAPTQQNSMVEINAA